MGRCLVQVERSHRTLRISWDSYDVVRVAGRPQEGEGQRRIRIFAGKSTRFACRSRAGEPRVVPRRLARVRVRGVLLRLADPAHHVAELLPHLLDGVRRLLLAERLEAGAAGLVLLDEL